MTEDQIIPLSASGDQLSPDRPQALTSVNGDHARTDGIEYPWMWRPSRRTWQYLGQVNNEFEQRYETDRRIFGGFRWEY